MKSLTTIDRSLQQIDRSLFWVNPDCGLKTRKEDEVKDALTVLVNTVRKNVHQITKTNPRRREQGAVQKSLVISSYGPGTDD